ncbi:MAG: hypothetical protein NTX17_01350 [Candidatus Eisenbacteria bacterium]|nr:hypothetical protein [Candidatus Eisenbacteria bacterium]
MNKTVIDWLSKLALGVVAGLLISYILFHGTLEKLEGKVDALQQQQALLVSVMMGQRELPQGPVAGK